jgi:hypothetical protein
MDFQSIALPTELPHHPTAFLQAGSKNRICHLKSEMFFRTLIFTDANEFLEFPFVG